MSKATAMVGILNQKAIRTRTGIIALPEDFIGLETRVAALLNIDVLDYTTYVLERLPSDSTYLNLTLQQIFEDLVSISDANTGSICLLLANFDLAVLHLSANDRIELWRMLLGDFPHHRRSLIFCLPLHDKLHFTIPNPRVRNGWVTSDRYAIWNP